MKSGRKQNFESKKTLETTIKKAEVVEYEVNLSISTEIGYDIEDNSQSDQEYSSPQETAEKYQFNTTLDDDTDDDLPFHYRHIRKGLRSVGDEYYVEFTE